MLGSDEFHEVLFLGRINPSHGLVILKSEESDCVHENWDPGVDPLDFGGDSLAISVRNPIDGPITLEALDSSTLEALPDDLNEIHNETWACDPEELCITDASGDIFVRLHSTEEDRRVRVFVDDLEEITVVRIVIGSEFG